MLLWIPALGLIIFGIFGLSGRGIRWTRESTLEGTQARVVGVVCILGGMLISPVGIMVLGSLINSGRSSYQPPPVATPTTDSSSTSTPPAPPPPPSLSPPPPPPATEPQASVASRSQPSGQPASRPTAWARGAFAKGKRLVVHLQLVASPITEDPTEAAKQALADFTWAVVDEVRVDQNASEIFIPCRSPKYDAASAKAALQRAGFQIGDSTVRPDDK